MILHYTEALTLLIALTISSTEVQKLVAFENAFDRIFALIQAEGGLTHGSKIVEDCLALLANLLGLNTSNQSYFRETGCVSKFAKLLIEVTNEQESANGVPDWASESRNKNLWGLLTVLQLFLITGGVGTPVNQMSFWQSGVMEQVLRVSFSSGYPIKVQSKVCPVSRMET